MKKLLLQLLVFVFIGYSYAQEMKISGSVFDSTGTKPLPKALAMAVRLKDSSLLGFDRADQNGVFNIQGVQIDTFNLIVSFPGYDDKSFFIFGSKDNKIVDIPSILMSNDKITNLGEVVIYTNKNPIYFRGDTLVYVADSFKVAENAVVEDLLKKLPGVKVDKDGKITSQGKEISQVLVDGDEFFGSDPTTATKNLGAKGVQTVEVFEKKNEKSTDGTDETIQVMNLKLKEDAKKGYFGRSSIASDFTNFYEGELLLNKFKGSQKISVFALGSNTPRSSFGNGDINKFGLDNEGGNFFNENGEMVRYSSANGGTGIPQTLKTGLYFADKIGKKKQTKVGFNYTFNDYQLNSLAQSRSQYFLPDTTYFTDDTTRNITHNVSHTVNFSINSKIDSLTNIEIKPKFIYSTGKTESKDYSTFIREDATQSRYNLIENITNSTGINIENELNFVKKFMKPRREINARYDITYTDNSSKGSLSNQNEFYGDSTFSFNNSQNKVTSNLTNNHNAKLTYYEPLSKKIKAEIEYMYEYNSGTQKKETRDVVNGIESDTLNYIFSNNFENIKQQNRISTSLIYEMKAITITAGVRVRNINIANKNLFNDSTIYQDINNVLPRFIFQFKPSMTKRVRFSYNTNASQPSLNDLQPVQNNSNPNKITIGNPNLQPSYTHNFSAGFNFWQALSGRYIWSRTNVSLINNAFGNSISYDEYNRQFSQTVNVDGNINASFSLGTGIPFYKKIFEISPNIEASYNKYSNYVSDIKNTTINQSITPELEFQIQLDSLYFSSSAGMTYTDPRSTISSVSNLPYTNQVYKAELQWTLPWSHIKINSDVTYNINSRRANGYNINYFIWNADISKAFLKTENLIVSIQGKDLFNQNISAQRQINGNIVTDNFTKIISRYFLFKLTYKFNNNKTKEEDYRGWH